MTEQITKYNAQILGTFDDVERAARAMVSSGFFDDAKQLGQATVKILAGQEIGIGPFASMVGIHIIKGKPTYGANIIASKVKGSGKYDYTVDELSNTACRLTFWQGSKELGKSVFTIDDAKKAGTQNLEKYARNMLFARAISNGQKWYCPDVTFVTMYTPEEFGAIVDDNGNITNPEVITVTKIDGSDKYEPPFPTPVAPPVPTEPIPVHEPHPSPLLDKKKETNPEPELEPATTRPYPPQVFREKLQKMIADLPGVYAKDGLELIATEHERKVLASCIDAIFGDKGVSRHPVCSWLVGTGATADMNAATIQALFLVMGIKNTAKHPAQFNDPPSAESIQEFKMAYEKATEKNN